MKKLLSLLFSALFPVLAFSTVLDFDDITIEVREANFEYGGFLFSPSCQGGIRGGVVDFDRGNSCQPNENINPDYVFGEKEGGDAGWGPLPKLVIMSLSGAKFDLKSLDLICCLSMSISSSNGGSITTGYYPEENPWLELPGVDGGRFLFSGPEWSNLAWIQFHGHSADHWWEVDNLVLEVPEPASVHLIALALLFCGLGITRSRRNSQRSIAKHGWH